LVKYINAKEKTNTSTLPILKEINNSFWYEYKNIPKAKIKILSFKMPADQNTTDGIKNKAKNKAFDLHEKYFIKVLYNAIKPIKHRIIKSKE
jgi:hypothetical protein